MKINLIIIFTLLVLSCNKKPEDYLEYNISKGSINIAADESLKLIAKAEVDSYLARYPKVKINLILVPEQIAVNLLLKDSVKVAIISRELNENELKFFERNKIKYQPAKFAYDAIALATNKNFAKDEISLTELQDLFNNTKSGIKLVFDNSNSSNLVYMQNKFNIKNLNSANIFGAEGTVDAINYIKKNSNSIAFLGYNWFSDEDDKAIVERKNSVKLLKVKKDNNSNSFRPNLNTIRTHEYPFTKLIYMQTTQEQWGVAKGFIRHSCSQVGQLVAEKMGLLPYYDIPKSVVLEK